MPLTRVDGMVVPDLNGVRFQMSDGSTRVPVLVTYIAIEDIEQPPTFDQEGALERFRQRRGDFESIASNKFDAGRLEEDGSVRVGQADLP